MAALMIGIVVLVIIALCAIFVYLDASANGIGDISEHRPNFNMSAMGWAIATLFLWPIAFPGYLRTRRRLIDAATDHRIQENQRFLKASGVTLAGVGFIVVSVALPGLPTKIGLPSCGSSETLIQLSKTLDANSVATMTDSDIVNITGTMEIDYLSDPIARVCSGTLITLKGDSSVLYVVRWEDASKKKLEVATQAVVR